MLYNIAKAVKTMINDMFNIVEFYDGQFEQFDEVAVNPPHAYVDISSGRSGKVGAIAAEIDMKIYVMTSSLVHNPDNMLDKLESVITALHDKAVRYDNRPLPGGEATASIPPAVYGGKCYCGEWKSLVTYPGLSVWELQLKIIRSEAETK